MNTNAKIIRNDGVFVEFVCASLPQIQSRNVYFGCGFRGIMRKQRKSSGETCRDNECDVQQVAAEMLLYRRKCRRAAFFVCENVVDL